MSNFDIKEKFAERFDDPEKNLEKLRTAYKNHTDLITSPNVWGDNGKRFFDSDKELAKWAVESTNASELPFSQKQTSAPQTQLPTPLPPLNAPSNFLHGGYPAVILLSVATFGVVFLAYEKILPPNFAVFAIILGVLLFFLPVILDKVLKILPVDRLLDREKSIPDLFKEAHHIFGEAIIAIRTVGIYEYTGKLEKDPAEQRKMETISDLLNIYGEIFHRSEKEWYNRSLVKQEYATRFAAGSGLRSDVPG